MHANPRLDMMLLSAAAVLLGVTAGCAGPPTARDVTLTASPNPNAPLAGILTFASDRPVVPSLLILRAW